MSGSGTIVVTGGGSGIGAATCLALRAAGWAVEPVDIAPADGISTMDVRDEDGWAGLMAGIDELAGVVNCAGIIRTHATIENLELADWREVIDTNLTGTFLGTRAALRTLRRQGRGGAIVNVASIAAFVPTPRVGHYIASKGGVVQFTKAAALEGGPMGVRVNAVAPGPTLTPLTAGSLTDPAAVEALEAKIPLRRIAQADDIAGVVAFLFSDAGAYLSGVTIPVDGGFLTQGPV